MATSKSTWAVADDGRRNFNVHLQTTPLDTDESRDLSRLEIIEHGLPITSIPIQRRTTQDGKGHYLNFELMPAMAAKCVLVVVERTSEDDGREYRADLYSYTPEGASHERPLFDEIVKIEFPNGGYQYTLTEAARGIKIEYKIVVECDFSGVFPHASGPSSPEPPGPSGLHPHEAISGRGQLYSLLDFGLAAPFQEVERTLRKGTYTHSFEWDSRNWTGPSDTGNPKGNPFPAGTYELSVTVHGRMETANGRVGYESTCKTKLVLK